MSVADESNQNLTRAQKIIIIVALETWACQPPVDSNPVLQTDQQSSPLCARNSPCQDTQLCVPQVCCMHAIQANT